MTADDPIRTGTAANGLKNSAQGGLTVHAVRGPAMIIAVLFLRGPSSMETLKSFSTNE